MKVFIPHASEEHDLANRLAASLNEQHIEASTFAHLVSRPEWKKAVQQGVSEAQGSFS